MKYAVAILVSSIVPSVDIFSKMLEHSFFNLNNFETSYYYIIESKHKKRLQYICW